MENIFDESKTLTIKVCPAVRLVAAGNSSTSSDTVVVVVVIVVVVMDLEGLVRVVDR